MIVTPSTRAKSAGVEIGKSGLQTATKKRGAGLRTVSFSPRPSASCVPPRMQKGTSLPTLALICSSRSSVRVGETSSRSARSTAAASALPPAMPASDGMRFISAMSMPPPQSIASQKALAALTARLRSSQGSAAPSTRQVMPLPSVSVTVTSSWSETVCMTICISW